MDLLLTSPPFWIAVGITLVVGFLVGRATGANASKLRALEKELDAEQQAHLKTRGEAEGYRKQVSEHFAQTSERLHDLTLQYRSVYDHLAKGASDLCPEGFAKLEGGLGLDALPEEAEPQPQPESASDPRGGP
jgi:uncharacterized membrane-anchored protein YhcB (DUF1043 family)